MSRFFHILMVVSLLIAGMARGQDGRPATTPTPTPTPTEPPAGDPSAVPPVLGAPDADKKMHILKALMEDLDPSIAYFILFPVAVEALWKLLKLPSALPDSWQSVVDLYNMRTNRTEYQRLKAAVKALKAARPELNNDLEKAATEYVDHLAKLEPMVEKLKELPELKGDAKALEELDRAIKLWKEKGEYHYLHRFLAKHKSIFATAAGQEWRRGHRDWLDLERAMQREAVIAANHVTDFLNAPRGERDRYPVFSTTDENSHHHPGRVYYDQDKRILGNNLAEAVKNRCEETYLALIGARASAGWKAGTVLGAAVSFGKAAMPLVRIGGTGALAFLAWRAYQKTHEKYGKTPTEMKIEGARQAQVRQQVKLNAEASLEAQVDTRRAEISPFTDALVSAIQDHQEEILQKLKDRGAATKTKLDMAKKRELFQSKPKLTREILVALPASIQTRIGRDFTMDHLLKLLSLSPKDERVGARQKQLVTATLWRAVDNLFPELDDFEENPDNPHPTRASSFLGKELRAKIVEEALKKLDPTKIKAPATVPPHGALPAEPTLAQQAAQPTPAPSK